MKTVGQARREKGIPESEYLRRGDTINRIGTIRCLARILGPPDSRTEHPESCQLHWYIERDVRVVVGREGAITS